MQIQEHLKNVFSLKSQKKERSASAPTVDVLIKKKKIENTKIIVRWDLSCGVQGGKQKEMKTINKWSKLNEINEKSQQCIILKRCRASWLPIC